MKISREFNTMLLASPRVYARTGKLFLDRIDETDMHWQSSVIKQIAEIGTIWEILIHIKQEPHFLQKKKCNVG